MITGSTQNILSSAKHQLPIPEDALAISNLSPNSMTTSPIPIEPISMVRRVLKILKAQLGGEGVIHDFQVKPT